MSTLPSLVSSTASGSSSGLGQRVPVNSYTSYQFGNKLPPYVSISEPSRETYEKSNEGSTSRQSTWNAEGGLIPIIYGTQRIGAKIALADNFNGTSLHLLCVFCEGEVDAIEVIEVNDIDITDFVGITVYTHLGSLSQVPDAALVSKFAGLPVPQVYDDSLPGICYAYIVIPHATGIDSFPRITARIRGKKVYDPRDGRQNLEFPDTWRYSNNPSICLADLITSKTFGLAKPVDWESVSLCANHNDKYIEEIGTPTVSTSPYPPVPMIDASSGVLINGWTIDLLWSYFKVLGSASITITPAIEFDGGDSTLNMRACYAFYKWLAGIGKGYWWQGIFYGTPGPIVGSIPYSYGGQSTMHPDHLDEEYYDKPTKDLIWGVFTTRPVASTIVWDWAWPIINLNDAIAAYIKAHNWASPYGYYDPSNGIAGFWEYAHRDMSSGMGYGDYFDPLTGAVKIWVSQGGNRYASIYPDSGKPLSNTTVLETTHPAAMLDIIIDSEQETVDWVDTLRGYASCFVYVDGNTYGLLPDKPVGYGFNALGSTTSYAEVTPYSWLAGTTYKGLSIEVTIKPGVLTSSTYTIIGKGTVGSEDYTIQYNHTTRKLIFKCRHKLLDLSEVEYTYESEANLPIWNQLDTFTLGIAVDAFAQCTMYYAAHSDYIFHEISIPSQPTPLTHDTVLNIPITNTNINIAYNGAGTTPFIGIIDEVRVWNRTRDIDEIEQFLFRPLPINYDYNLVCHIPFNEGINSLSIPTGTADWLTASLARDFSGDGRFATLYGDTSTYGGVVETSNWAQIDAAYDFYNFNTTNILENSIKFKKRASRNIPTIIELGYTDTTELPWRENYAVVNMSSVVGKYRVSRVPMPGITRYSQAYREAVQRYNNIVSDIAVSFQALDDSLNLTVGDPIQIHHPLIENNPDNFFKPYRVSAVQQNNDTGIWSISAVEYDSLMYSTEPVVIPSFLRTNIPIETEQYGTGWSTTIYKGLQDPVNPLGDFLTPVFGNSNRTFQCTVPTVRQEFELQGNLSRNLGLTYFEVEVPFTIRLGSISLMVGITFDNSKPGTKEYNSSNNDAAYFAFDFRGDYSLFRYPVDSSNQEILPGSYYHDLSKARGKFNTVIGFEIDCNNGKIDNAYINGELILPDGYRNIRWDPTKNVTPFVHCYSYGSISSTDINSEKPIFNLYTAKSDFKFKSPTSVYEPWETGNVGLQNALIPAYVNEIDFASTPTVTSTYTISTGEIVWKKIYWNKPDTLTATWYYLLRITNTAGAKFGVYNQYGICIWNNEYDSQDIYSIDPEYVYLENGKNYYLAVSLDANVPAFNPNFLANASMNSSSITTVLTKELEFAI